MSNPGSETPDLPETPRASVDAARPADSPDAGAASEPRRRSLFGGVMGHLRQMTTDVVSVALGRAPGSPNGADAGGEVQDGSTLPAKTDRVSTPRLRLLEGVANQLRGAADSFIAAKLDELEERVDAKLDHIEARIDSKIVELHEQLRTLRDKELRHRLRLLKITLIFTVIVAALSLCYKWISTHWVA